MAMTDTYVDPSKQTRTSVTITNSTTTATVTQVSHGYSNSDVVKIHNANESEYNGNFTISNVTTDTYDYTMASDPGGSATGSPVASKLNLSGDDGSTSALAYADLQYALDSITRNSTDGDVIHIKAGTAEVLSAQLSYTTYGTPAVAAPLAFRGYSSTARDGGIAEIDGNGAAVSNQAYIGWADLKIHNGGTADLIAGSGNFAYNCWFSDTTGYAFNGSSGSVTNCVYSDWGSSKSYGFFPASGSEMKGCYLEVDSSNQPSTYVIAGQNGAKITDTILNMKTGVTCGGIWAFSNSNRIKSCSILSAAGTGTGIENNNGYYNDIQYNIVEGFSGTGGEGINYNSATTCLGMVGFNACYNNTTDFVQSGVASAQIDLTDDDETLSSSAFAKSGRITLSKFVSDNAGFWSDVAAYFEPQDTGNVFGNFGFNALTKGAVPRPVSVGSTGIDFLSKFTPNPASDLVAGGTLADDLAHIDEMNWPGWTTYSGAPTLEGARLKMLSADRTTYGNGSYTLNFAGFDYGKSDVQIFAHALSSTGQPGIVVRHDPTAKTFYMVYRSSTTLHVFYFNGSSFDSSLTNTSISAISNDAFDLIGARVVGNTLEAFYNDSTTPLLTHTMTNNLTATGIGVLGNASNTYYNHYAVMEPHRSYSNLVPYSLSVPNTAKIYSLHPLAYN